MADANKNAPGRARHGENQRADSALPVMEMTTQPANATKVFATQRQKATLSVFASGTGEGCLRVQIIASSRENTPIVLIVKFSPR